MNAEDSRWRDTGTFGAFCNFEGKRRFPGLGINLNVLQPGQPMGLYHRENAQEDFLVLAGECLLLVEGDERKLKTWDFFHCPSGTEHIIVGAGKEPVVVLAVGARVGGESGLVYLVSRRSRPKRRVGVEQETTDPAEAYGGSTGAASAHWYGGWLPDLSRVSRRSARSRREARLRRGGTPLVAHRTARHPARRLRVRVRRYALRGSRSCIGCARGPRRPRPAAPRARARRPRRAPAAACGPYLVDRHRPAELARDRREHRVLEPAGRDPVGERRRVEVDVERVAVRRHPARDVDADRGDLARRPLEPDAGQPLDPRRLDAERRRACGSAPPRGRGSTASRRGRAASGRGSGSRRAGPGPWKVDLPPRSVSTTSTSAPSGTCSSRLVGAPAERDDGRVLEQDDRVGDRALRDGAASERCSSHASR